MNLSPVFEDYERDALVLALHPQDLVPSAQSTPLLASVTWHGCSGHLPWSWQVCSERTALGLWRLFPETLGSFLRFKSMGQICTQLLSPPPPLGSLGGSNVTVALCCFNSLSAGGGATVSGCKGTASWMPSGERRDGDDKDAVRAQLAVSLLGPTTWKVEPGGLP